MTRLPGRVEIITTSREKGVKLLTSSHGNVFHSVQGKRKILRMNYEAQHNI